MTDNNKAKLTQRIVETLAESALTAEEAEVIMGTALKQYQKEWAKE